MVSSPRIVDRLRGTRLPANRRTYAVSGMTCEHCRRAVVEEVARIPGVRRTSVDLDAGRLTAVGAFAPGAVAAAVAAAGYEVVP
jgi:copper chaperone